MHILQVTLGFYPAQGWGGPVKVVHQNSKELIRRGHQVTVICSNLMDKKTKIKPHTFQQVVDGIKVIYFNAWNISTWPGTLGPIWLPELPDYISKNIASFDVVHVNGYRNPMVLPIVHAARRANIPIVTQPHGTMPVIVNSFFVKRVYDLWLGKFELEGIQSLIALQESEREQASAYGVSPNIISIIPNGVDIHEWDHLPPRGEFRKRLGLFEKAPVILFLARINKKKGADMLVEAFAQMNNKAAQLVIAGPDDGQLAEVQALVAKYGLENRVFFPGLLSGLDVGAAFQDADLFVLPCRADTFPVTIMEACLAGVPMLITDRCEIAHLVKDKIADVVPFDAAIFATALDRLLDDRSHYEFYKKNCPKVMADTFSIEASVDKLELIYQQVKTQK
jgi:glycosyltransferase involved in cell wall biosynthesis